MQHSTMHFNRLLQPGSLCSAFFPSRRPIYGTCRSVDPKYTFSADQLPQSMEEKHQELKQKIIQAAVKRGDDPAFPIDPTSLKKLLRASRQVMDSAGKEREPEGVLADIEEVEDGYHLFIDTPGINVAKTEISVNPERRIMTVTWTRERNSPPSGTPAYRGKYERKMGTFRREVVLARDCDPSTIHAKLENGVLHISAKKRLPARSINITVE